jgi:cytochrome c553
MVTVESSRRAIWGVGWLALGVAFAHAADGQEPLWAYGFRTPPAAGEIAAFPAPPTHQLRANEDAAAQLAPQHVAGSDAAYSLLDIRYGGQVPDWFPNEHPPMPPVVAHGSKKLGRAAYACAFCHLPTGRGRPENAPVSGQPAAYFIRQIQDFRQGNRHSADPRKPNTLMMIALAKAMTDDEVRDAAAYFGAIKWTPWIRVVETDEAPKTRIEGNLFIAIDAARTDPLAGRIVEVPEDEIQARDRNPHSGFVAYVPVGSLAQGEDLVKTGGLKGAGGKATAARTVACATCHGPDLMGLAEVPAIAGRSPSYLARQLYDFQQGTRKGTFAPLMQPVVAALTGADIVAITAYVASLEPPAAPRP